MSKRLCSVTVQIAPAGSASFLELASVIENGGVLEAEPVVYTFKDGSAYAVQAYWMPADWDEPIDLQPAEISPDQIPVIDKPASVYEVVDVRAAPELTRSVTDYELIGLFDLVALDLSPRWAVPNRVKIDTAAARIAEFSARMLACEYGAAAAFSATVERNLETWNKAGRPIGPPPAFDEEAEPAGSWAGVNDYPTPVEELDSFKAQVVALFAELRAVLDFLGWVNAPPSEQMSAAIARMDAFEWLRIRASGGADVMAAACQLSYGTVVSNYPGRPAPKYLAE